MKQRGRMIGMRVLLALLVLALSALARTAMAQAPAVSTPSAAPPGYLPTTDVPFFAEWASSPHADHAAQAFTHWNQDGAIPPECAKCHSAPGFIDFLGSDGTQSGVVDHPAPVGTVITCIACHNDRSMALTSVTFPSGLKVDHLAGSEAICMTCHQGLESTASVTKALAGLDDDAVQPKLQFLNVHYALAGAMMMGTQARVAYEYPGKKYAGRLAHAAPFTSCTSCHQVHTTEVAAQTCTACHKEVTDRASLHLIRVSKTDYDGTGEPNEGIADEIGHMSDKLYAAIQAYGKTVAGKAIVYDPNAYPYFFVDSNGDGVADKNELRVPNQYNAWTPRLMKAAFNYHFARKDPGAFAHNPNYALQILYDSLADLGDKVPVDIAKAKRP